MKSLTAMLAGAGCVLITVAVASTPAGAFERAERLLGGNENPPVVSDGTGRFGARVEEGKIDFSLRYDVGEVTQAHIHLANPGNNGAIAVFLCSNLDNTPEGATERECPPAPAKVEGTILADDVQQVLDDTTQVLEAGDLEGLALLMRQGATYANVHTADHASGELRGQVNPRPR